MGAQGRWAGEEGVWPAGRQGILSHSHLRRHSANKRLEQRAVAGQAAGRQPLPTSMAPQADSTQWWALLTALVQKTLTRCKAPQPRCRSFCTAPTPPATASDEDRFYTTAHMMQGSPASLRATCARCHPLRLSRRGCSTVSPVQGYCSGYGNDSQQASPRPVTTRLDKASQPSLGTNNEQP